MTTREYNQTAIIAESAVVDDPEEDGEGVITHTPKENDKFCKVRVSWCEAMLMAVNFWVGKMGFEECVTYGTEVPFRGG